MSLKPKHDPRETYWRSLAGLAESPEAQVWLEAEFPTAADPGGINRRRWLEVMGASLALASVGGCRWETEEILPLVSRPDGYVPGKPLHYATAMDTAGVAEGLLVTSMDGRPIKVEGNPKHPQSLGATGVHAQAAVLPLYDPDRSRQVIDQTEDDARSTDWAAFTQFADVHFERLRQAKGGGFRVLSAASSSPTLAALRDELLDAFPQAVWHEFEPVTRDNERLGAARVFGNPYRVHPKLAEARVIVCLDADPLGSHPASVRLAHDFAQSRELSEQKTWMSRLYAVESGYSLSGAAADHRLPLRPAEIAQFASALEAALRGTTFAGHDDTSPVGKFFRAVVEDLLAGENKGHSVVMAGSGQPPAVHAAVHRINALLENVGQTVHYTAEPNPDRPTHVDSIRDLAAAMAGGQVDTLLVLGGNPVYNAPADVEFTEALEKVATSIHLSLYRDETSRGCTWHLPEAHFLETWGDARSWDGTYSVAQPLIRPLHGGRSAIELLATVLGSTPADGQTDGQSLVRTTFGSLVEDGDDMRKQWRKTIHDGLLAGSEWPLEVPEPMVIIHDGDPAPPVIPSPQWEKGPVDVIFAPDARLFDGRFANNGWLQELPEQMTKITWDNAAILGPETALALAIEDNMVVRLSLGGEAVELPAYVLPGQATGTVTVWLGYGRTAAGLVGGSTEDQIEPVGKDLYALRTADTMCHATGATLEATGQRYDLATTQDHHAIDTTGGQGRDHRLGDLVMETTEAAHPQYADIAKHLEHLPELESPWDEHSYDGRRWGMAIDLSKCIGCGACVVACQAENNIPIVGRQRIRQGREMHWLRIDRYFKGDPDRPQAVCQPVACQQCELAPCEQVCPVAATVHSAEGLNDMVYNRCVGTRYCANNCPYKVRRFNYFNYRKDLEDPRNATLKMALNPDVTVRSRGVMEKCT
ncbi:MAG: TAT-variant-translocated molybdopterin oxidoreductase, partial [Planctomycetes bacterium]|nr:TAT-variant-translocated molybdopterin oxidoreductase [Planctomycetota bacterium]